MKLGFILGLVFIPAFIHAFPFVDGPDDEGYIWTDIKELGVRGRGWDDNSLLFNRLPASAETVVR